MKKVTKIAESPSSLKNKKKIRVAAYCRVSTSSDAQLESLDAQKIHYENYINNRDDWKFAGIYYDEGITGTKKEKRPELLRLVDDCKAGKIDFIVTKSISRFSRNTTDCLEIVRDLLALRIPIYFEKENINTGSMESELFLSLLSTLAENESVSIAENIKWSIQKRFEAGTFKVCSPPYGYDWDGKQMIVNQGQAAVVKEIFAMLLSGKSTQAIANALNERNVPSKRSRHWTSTTIRNMITNEKYVGDCLFQKTYSDSHFQRHNNHGEMTQYLVKDHHLAIIQREDFENAQKLILQRASEKGVVRGSEKYQNHYAFSGKVFCDECGGTFKRRIHSSSGHKYVAWCCSTHLLNKDKCHMLFMRDKTLKDAFIIMMNKLICFHQTILAPYLQALKRAPDDDSLKRIQKLHTLITQNSEKRETLAKLLSQGVIGPVIYNKGLNELLSQYDTYQKEMNALKHSISDSLNHVSETTRLLRFAEKSSPLTAFDETLFEQFVDSILIRSRDEICYVLKCGLTLTERRQ